MLAILCEETRTVVHAVSGIIYSELWYYGSWRSPVSRLPTDRDFDFVKCNVNNPFCHIYFVTFVSYIINLQSTVLMQLGRLKNVLKSFFSPGWYTHAANMYYFDGYKRIDLLCPSASEFSFVKWKTASATTVYMATVFTCSRWISNKKCGFYVDVLLPDEMWHTQGSVLAQHRAYIQTEVFYI